MANTVGTARRIHGSTKNGARQQSPLPVTDTYLGLGPADLDAEAKLVRMVHFIPKMYLS